MQAGQEAIKLIFLRSSLGPAFAGELNSPPAHVHLPAALSFHHQQVSGQNSRRAGSHRVKGEKVQLGQAGSCLRPAFLPAGWPGPRLPALPFTLPLSRDPVLACALPQLSESLDLSLLSWPLTPHPAQTSSVICSFVLVIILSGRLKWPSTTHKQSEREREFHLVNWVKVKKQKGYFYFFKQVTCATCIGQPLDLIDPLVPMVSLIELSKQRRKHRGFKASTLPPTSDLRALKRIATKETKLPSWCVNRQALFHKRK